MSTPTPTSVRDPSSAQAEPTLVVENLHVRFRQDERETHAVRGVSFNLGREKLAIVGESGSGKSTVGRALLGLLPRSARVEADVLRLDGQDLRGASEATLRQLRGRRISMIMQDPKYALNPVMRVGEQIAEACLTHHRVSRAEAWERTLAMLASVRIQEPARVARLYPHEVSGGMGQRVMIAMMLITEPELLIADEPTSALDVSVRQQVLNILDEQVRERGLGLLFISHDLPLVRRFCDRVLVMYAGRVVESLPASQLDQASHPYTQGLMAALPRLRQPCDRLPVLQRDPAWAL
ncbi:MAG: ABC transporter ATP-binding protein [Sphaerotilus natans subsp. sulfidivorans]|uniref:ABC transporter ATP-binding protein n=1 Tax=Sphaerotilus sulfidivorans TaxID=639200 RepID=UPI0023578FF0|nr:ABC transporter ATP-binding protein [Sphaerotilus sulfidivorans]MCK6403818.1 ABC transporter ATP-binding protein [Sphaerotilus sulfidivorans]